MNARRIIELVTEHAEKNPFELAALIAAEQREADALVAEQAGSYVIAEAIRAAS